MPKTALITGATSGIGLELTGLLASDGYDVWIVGHDPARLEQVNKMTAVAVARAGYDGMKQQSMVVIPGLTTKALALAGELPPRRIALEVNRLLWKPRSARNRPGR